MKPDRPDAQRLAASALADLDRAGAAIRQLATAVEHPLQEQEMAPLPGADHLRQHRMGTPSRLDTDPELRAFVIARVSRMTFPQLAQAIAQTFPKHRRVSQSTIHRWWHREGKLIAHNHLSSPDPR
ncbi:MAG: hypothetical protein LBE86_13050 [Gemmobacter sp.]|jgi:hypothetical protein|nr:hypothetical protein [Gemmobacter sp.]